MRLLQHANDDRASGAPENRFTVVEPVDTVALGLKKVQASEAVRAIAETPRLSERYFQQGSVRPKLRRNSTTLS